MPPNDLRRIKATEQLSNCFWQDVAHLPAALKSNILSETQLPQTCEDLLLVSTGSMVVLALRDLLRTLQYRHSASRHAEILNSLRCDGIVRHLFDAACAEYGVAGNFEIFTNGFLRQARRARERGLVRPDGERRRPGGGRKPYAQKVGVSHG